MNINEKLAKVMGWRLDQDESCYYDENNERIYALNRRYSKRWGLHIWQPITDLNQLFMVVDKMIEDGFDFTLDYDEEYGYSVGFWSEDVMYADSEVKHKDRNTAIAKSIVKAVGG